MGIGESATTRPEVAVFGASKFGRWHVREYLSAGCDVVAILGSSDESARETASILSESFGCAPRAYGDVNRLLDNEELDPISIVTPPQTHYEFAEFAIARGIDFLLEKTTVRGADPNETFMMYSHLTNDSRRKGVMFANQQQNVALIDQFSGMVGEDVRKSSNFYFEVRNGGNLSGLDLAEDQLPHPLSMLTEMFGAGVVEQGKIDLTGPLTFDFKYYGRLGDCSCHFKFNQVPGLTREENVMKFGFDGKELLRRQSTEGGFRQWFEYDGREHDFVDPLGLSIKAFVAERPLVSAEDGLNSLKAQLALQYG